MNLYTVFHDICVWNLKIFPIHSLSSGLNKKYAIQVIRPSVAAEALHMWHFSAKASFKGASPFTGLSNLCLLSCFPSSWTPCLQQEIMDYTPWLCVIRRDSRKRRQKKLLCKFCWLQESTNTKRKSHLHEFYTKHFTISLRISLSITQSIPMELLRIFSPVWEKKHVSALDQWIYNVHITDLRKINWSVSEVGFHTVKDNLIYEHGTELCMQFNLITRFPPPQIPILTLVMWGLILLYPYTEGRWQSKSNPMISLVCLDMKSSI